jgi:hypothetical protein
MNDEHHAIQVLLSAFDQEPQDIIAHFEVKSRSDLVTIIHIHEWEHVCGPDSYTVYRVGSVAWWPDKGEASVGNGEYFTDRKSATKAFFAKIEKAQGLAHVHDPQDD